MKAIGKYIVIKPIEEEVKTDSGLILSAQDVGEFRYRRGRVLTPGLDVVGINPGDEVVIFADNHPSNFQAWHEKAKRFGFKVEHLVAVVAAWLLQHEAQ